MIRPMAWLEFVRKRWKIALQLVVLVVFAALYAFDTTAFVVVLSLVLIVSPAVTWTVAGILVWAARQAPDIVSLTERADDAVTLALGSSAGAVVGGVAIGRTVGILDPQPGLTLVLLAFALISLPIPAAGWLITWRTTLVGIRHRHTEEQHRTLEGDGG